MEPSIQYAKAKDGVSIAFWSIGEGMPLVQAIPWSHLHEEWQVPELRRWFERLARRRRLVRYDHRGCGMSERDVSDYSLDAMVLDLEAIADRLGLERFALAGNQGMGLVATAYAARHPEQVSHLILWCSWMKSSDAMPPQLRGLGRLMDVNWDLYTESAAHALFGWTEGEPAHRYATVMRESLTGEQARAQMSATRQYDVADLVTNVRARTLVFHGRRAPFPRVEDARELAASIPNARLLLLECSAVATSEPDLEAMEGAIDELLSEGEETSEPTAPLAKEAVHTILFTDVEGSTALTQRLGDAKARDLLRQHERMVREALKAHGGSELKTMGDGFMASFSSATKALECSIAMQRAFAAHNEPAEEPILVRVGLNAGEPIAEEKDLYGTAVNLAARICGYAEAGQILASDVVRQLVAGKDFLFADRGEVALKGFDEPVRLFEVKWQE